jgi:hypothetical protein
VASTESRESLELLMMTTVALSVSLNLKRYFFLSCAQIISSSSFFFHCCALIVGRGARDGLDESPNQSRL